MVKQHKTKFIRLEFTIMTTTADRGGGFQQRVDQRYWCRGHAIGTESSRCHAAVCERQWGGGNEQR